MVFVDAKHHLYLLTYKKPLYIFLHLTIVHSCTFLGEVVVVYFIGMNVFGSFSLWEPYALCAPGTVNAQGFVWKFLCPISYIFIHSFIFNKHTKHKNVLPGVLWRRRNETMF